MTSEEVLANVQALAPEIMGRGEEIAQARRLPPDLVDKLKSAGVYRIMAPKAFGGLEMPPLQQCELIEILAYADASVSWVVKIGADSGFISSVLEEGAARELFPDVDMAIAGQATINGRAVKAPGGYRVSGRWSFASGSTHADVMMGGCIVEGEPEVAPGVPSTLFALAPAQAWTVEDTWRSMGLHGSGSHHYSARDLFIPERHTFRGAELPRHPGPFFRLPFTTAVSLPWAGTPLGLMRRAIDEAIAVARAKTVVIPVPTPMKALPRVRLAIARAEAMHGAARAYVYESIGQLQAEMLAGRPLPDHLRRAVGLSRIHAFRTAAQVAQMMVDAIGPPAILAACPLDRVLRDAVTVNQHLLLNDGVVEQLGASILGDGPVSPFV